MHVTMLGTGAADGWPNPFCACASCSAERQAGRSRASTSALIDGRVLIDCGPTVPHAATRAGIDLAAVCHVLVTHGHPDHLAPAFLLWRQWVDGLADLHVWGPPAAMALCQEWVAPGAPVTLHELSGWDVLTLELPSTDDTYRVRAIPAAHGHGNGDALAEEALLYDLRAPDGARLLYATDTGCLPAQTLDAIDSSIGNSSPEPAFDLVLVDATFGLKADHGTGHLDLATLPAFLDDLRQAGSIAPTTDVVAVHLGHHNPPREELAPILAGMGVRAVDDLAVIDAPAQSAHSRPARGQPAPARHLVLGGARSGKSTYAERLAAVSASVRYVATAAPRPDDAEWAERVRQHRDRRPAHWHTVETFDLPAALAGAAAGETVLIDCIGMWLTAHLDARDAWSDDPDTVRRAREQVLDCADELIEAIADCPASVIIVSNEVGMDVVPATASGRLFRDLLGIVNARLARACEHATMMIAGRPLPLPRDGHRPPAGCDLP
ncbi:MAG: bifunctional adenosylcobinamide kinase/adenosylcobinamide-phosphate guanylyltransferase [Actinomycetales bacterium]|nr:bifunctional adenosylcobinamide kinase/adenosylcobinamide-phosphate guanylyltransferase [Actinomycetales bacterium]